MLACSVELHGTLLVLSLLCQLHAGGAGDLYHSSAAAQVAAGHPQPGRRRRPRPQTGVRTFCWLTLCKTCPDMRWSPGPAAGTFLYPDNCMSGCCTEDAQQTFSEYFAAEMNPGPSFPTADVVWGQTERDRV
jgi:hypothetical protein